MSAYGNQVKADIERYQSEVGSDGMLDPHAVAEWAYKHGLLKPSIRTVVDVIASDISQYFREEYRTSEDGQRYRAKHVPALGVFATRSGRYESQLAALQLSRH